jgi:hypothetical protein
MVQRSVLIFFIALYLISTLYVMSVFIPGSAYGINNTPVGREVRPPVAYRVLMPTVTSVVRSLMPDTLVQAASPYLISARDSEVGKRLLRLSRLPAIPEPLSDARIFDTSIQMFLVWLSLLAFTAMLYLLTKELFPAIHACALLAPLVFLWLLPVPLSRFAYTYDFAELFFSCATMYLLLRRQWWFYMGCLAVATLNKETSIFVIFFFIVWFYPRLPRRFYIKLCIMQLLLYAIVHGMVYLHYNIHLEAMHRYSNFVQKFTVHMNYMYGYSFHTFIAFLGTLLLLFYRWEEKPAFLLGALWMFLPNMAAYVLLCNDGEYRDLFWSMPPMVILATHSLVLLTNAHKVTYLQVAARP